MHKSYSVSTLRARWELFKCIIDADYLLLGQWDFFFAMYSFVLKNTPKVTKDLLFHRWFSNFWKNIELLRIMGQWITLCHGLSQFMLWNINLCAGWGQDYTGMKDIMMIKKASARIWVLSFTIYESLTFMNLFLHL